MKILITTGIYPPKIGGPAQYAKNLDESLKSSGHEVSVLSYEIEDRLPTGIRHFWFFLRVLPKLLKTDFLISLDTFSVGFPTVLASRLFGKKVIIRTGGDFLWESYIERTGHMVLLRNFYTDRSVRLNFKEKIIKKITGWTLRKADKVVFSTSWQKNIWLKPYGLKENNTTIIENYYGQKEERVLFKQKVFLGGTRDLKWKNLGSLKAVFKRLEEKGADISLDIENRKFDDFMDKMKESYAVILISIGDISPNMILDAIRLGKPFICSRENGLNDRIKDIGIFVDPLDTDDVEKAVVYLSDEKNYNAQLEKIRSFDFTHSYLEIAEEFLNVQKEISLK